MSDALPTATDRLPNTGPNFPSPGLSRSASRLPGSQSMAVISPAQHAVLDYAVAGTFFAMGTWLMSRHRAAAQLAFLNGGMVLGMSMLTDYQGGLYRAISFNQGHRTGDIIQAALAGLGPLLFGFGRDREAQFFYGQALSEAGVIAATDWNGNTW
jgi:hypothetical protein